jgi:3-phenylpropionate/trans-cinnamate dioxygenase ferredoxin reductase component
MTSLQRIAVIGANVAGIQTVESLRTYGYDGELIVLDADPEAPYNRPPLSKEYLAGGSDEDDISLIEEDELRQLDVDLRAGCRAINLDLGRRLVRTSADPVPFDRLVIATGSAPIVPSAWSGLDGICPLRTVEDARVLRTALRSGSPRVVVIGGGLIGCEVAASARSMGLDVTLVNAGQSLLRRVLPPVLAAPLGRAHRSHGVRVITGRSVISVQGSPAVAGVELDDGTMLDADVVVVGIGARPQTAWLRDSGLPVSDGIVTDRNLQASGTVFAAGDIARVTGTAGPPGTRAEHWTSARRQGTAAAAAVLGRPHQPDSLASTYVWSDQYGVRLQVFGSAHGDAYHQTELDADTGRHLTLVGRAGRVAGAVSYGSSGFAKAKRLVTAGTSWREAALTTGVN